MSGLDARALFAAARDDAPDAGEREAVFREVALATGMAAAAATALAAVPSGAAAGAATTGAAELATGARAATGAVTKAGGALGLKLLALGAALGAASTALGVLLAVTVVMPASSRAPGRAATMTAPATTTGGAKLAQPEARKRDPANVGAAAEPAAAKNDTEATGGAGAKAGANAAGDSDLAEEARLLTAARTALMSGDAATALALVQATRKLSARSLEPEELGLEVRALRALGRADDAAATELVLRRRYPDHALAR